jgi:pimeloyl-[acyl-carrier protein] methyl ester esterase
MGTNDTIKLVFMPGLDGTGISFEPLRKFLSGNITTAVVRYPTDRLLSFEEIVDCAYEQIVGDQDIVVAESFSGPVAIALIGSGKLKTKGLILCATFAKAPRPAMLKILNRLPLEFCIGLPIQSVLFRYFIGNQRDRNALIPIWQKVMSMVSAKILAHRIRLLSLVDVCHWLPALTMPCWYIQATKDRLLPESIVLDLAEAIPHLVVRKISGPHFILQTEPEASAVLIKELINLITSQAS